MLTTHTKLTKAGPDIEAIFRFGTEMQDGETLQTAEFHAVGHVMVSSEPSPKYAPHPVDRILKENRRVIPIRLISDDIDVNLVAKYEAYSASTNRMDCCGDGQTARRIDVVTGVAKELVCVGPEGCEYARGGQTHCDLKVRLRFQLDLSGDQMNELKEDVPRYSDLFEFRSGSINSLRTLRSNLTTLKGLHNGLRGLSLDLLSYEKCTPQSDGTVFYVARLAPRAGMTIEEVNNSRTKLPFIEQLGAAIKELDDANQLYPSGDDVVSLMPEGFMPKNTIAGGQLPTSISELLNKAKAINQTKGLSDPVAQTADTRPVIKIETDCTDERSESDEAGQPQMIATTPPSTHHNASEGNLASLIP